MGASVRTTTWAAVCVAVVLLLAGCSSGSGKSHAPAATSTTKSAGASTTTASTASASTASPTTSLPDIAIAAFETPSRNIACNLGDQGTRCDIHDHDWTPPPKPADCPLAWGDAVEVSSGSGAQFSCHGDTVFDASDPVLPYGQRARQGSTVCDSESAGVTCTDADGHGFFLSRASYRLF